MIHAHYSKEKANIEVCRRLGRIELDETTLEKIIADSLPANIKDYKNYVCDLTLDFKIYGIGEEEIKIVINREGNK